MAGWYRATVTVPKTGGLPKDAVTNTWHYATSESTPDRDAVAGAFDVMLAGFYEAWVEDMASPAYDWAHMVVDHYDFMDPRPRLPFNTSEIGATPPAGSLNELPAEVAIVLSMEATITSGVNARRRRGRVYVGPFATGAADLPLVPTVNAQIIADAAEAAFFTATQPKLAVYSRAHHYGMAVGETIGPEDDEIPANLGTAFNEVVKFYVDNAWDTQRRRGLAATSRQTRLRP